jgi:nucleoside-diphosphate-sugar epimerase
MHSSSARSTALLAGASGFTGRYLEPALKARGYSVVRLDPGGSEPCDITDPAAVDGLVAAVNPDVAIHLAGVTYVGHENTEDFYRVNVIGSMNLITSLARLKRPPKCVIMASSAHVYGTPPIEVLDESLCPAPINHYGCSKLAMEQMARTWFDRLPIIITRPFNYTGPGQAEYFLVPKIVKHFVERAPIIELGNLHVSRDYMDVEDVVALYIALLESGARSQVVNVCSGRPIALMEILETMKQISGHDIQVQVNPKFVRANEVPRLTGDTAKLQELIQVPEPRPFVETLHRMYNSATKLS